jgi:hypothetical protein
MNRDSAPVPRDRDGGLFAIPAEEIERWHVPDEAGESLEQALSRDEVSGSFVPVELLVVIASTEILYEYLVPNVGAVRNAAASAGVSSRMWAMRLPHDHP